MFVFFDSLQRKGPATWRELIEGLEQAHRIQVQSLSLGGELLWSQFAPGLDEDEDVRATLEQRGLVGRRAAVLFSVAADLDPDGAESDVDENAELPDIRFWLRPRE